MSDVSLGGAKAVGGSATPPRFASADEEPAREYAVPGGYPAPPFGLPERAPIDRVVVPFPGPPGKDAEVVIEGEFNYTHEQQTPAKVWTFQNPLGRQITSCRVIYPTTTDGETVFAQWDTVGTTVIVQHGAPATGKAIIG
ncbi:hypothetical protein PQD13_gp68 [Gordonia phage Clawz]|uniref:Uncharacterized protein n=1 Tax=Gordonia phage Clawz TaxID=2743910 RepID=A0AAE7FAH1_9CAUD|nr:hypothetical protein PQD13_gp68 [Gordonia phage Clawz]QKY79980.1 hypothetical protein SEA_CLAWZ_68 [Gordonia phage Clawz]